MVCCLCLPARTTAVQTNERGRERERERNDKKLNFNDMIMYYQEFIMNREYRIPIGPSRRLSGK